MKLNVMKKYLLCCLLFIICLIVSCSKGSNNITENNVFVPVQIHLMYGGSSVCSYGYFVIRQDTSGITYHSNKLPASPNLPPSGLINIQFHDTIIPHSAGCWPHEIVIDSMRH